MFGRSDHMSMIVVSIIMLLLLSQRLISQSQIDEKRNLFLNAPGRGTMGVWEGSGWYYRRPVVGCRGTGARRRLTQKIDVRC